MDRELMARRIGAAFLSSAVAISLAIVFATPALASPMVYTAKFVTNIKIGHHSYSNASVTIVFRGDTADIGNAESGGMALASSECTDNGGVGYFKYLTKGAATIIAHSAGVTIKAKLKPGQVFVALDSCNGGIGFGSFVTGGLEIAYPVGFTLGTAMSGAVQNDLTIPVSMSGAVYSCIGYPPDSVGNLPGNSGMCTPPDAYPLFSDNGNVYVYQPYTFQPYISNHGGSMNRGTFSIAPDVERDE
jgi:hypothetical protein